MTVCEDSHHMLAKPLSFLKKAIGIFTKPFGRRTIDIQGWGGGRKIKELLWVNQRHCPTHTYLEASFNSMGLTSECRIRLCVSELALLQ